MGTSHLWTLGKYVWNTISEKCPLRNTIQSRTPLNRIFFHYVFIHFGRCIPIAIASQTAPSSCSIIISSLNFTLKNTHTWASIKQSLKRNKRSSMHRSRIGGTLRWVNYTSSILYYVISQETFSFVYSSINLSFISF